MEFWEDHTTTSYTFAKLSAAGVESRYAKIPSPIALEPGRKQVHYDKLQSNANNTLKPLCGLAAVDTLVEHILCLDISPMAEAR